MAKKLTYFLFFFGCIFATYAQLDNSNGNSEGGKIIGTITAKTSVKEVKKPISLEFKNDNGLKNANKKEKEKREKLKKQQAKNNQGIITEKMIAMQRAKKNIEGNFKGFPMIDMDLGSFHTRSKNVHISSYDFGRFDGDKVMISVNGKRVHNNYLLTPKVKTIVVPLDVGINKIEVTALNEGQLSPNTGYFAFFDDNKYVIKEGQWTLATGAKVIAIVVRDKK